MRKPQDIAGYLVLLVIGAGLMISEGRALGASRGFNVGHMPRASAIGQNTQWASTQPFPDLPAGGTAPGLRSGVSFRRDHGWGQNMISVASATPVQATTTDASPDPDHPSSIDPVNPFQGWAFLWTLLGIFVGGAALNLTPCIYPLIPITVSYFGGYAATGGEGQPKARLAAHALCYIIGLALMNSLLGVVAALTGGLLGSALQSPMVSLLVAAILLFFATSLMGLWEIRVPSGLLRIASRSYAGLFGSLFMGLTLGLVAAPCIGPFVIGLLTWVASMGSAWTGFMVFFTLSLGMGMPLFFLALFSGQLGKLPRSGEWMVWFRKLLGWVMVGMAVYFLQPILSGSWQTILLTAVVLGAGFHLGWADKTRSKSRAFQRLRKLLGAASLVTAVWIIAPWVLPARPEIAWKPYSHQALQEAQQTRRPVIIDFYAEWCLPCRELDRVTFRNPQVVERATKDFVTLKVDITHSSNPFGQGLTQHYGIRGVPTVLFIDHKGMEKRNLRVLGFIPPKDMLDRMAELVDAETRR